MGKRRDGKRNREQVQKEEINQEEERRGKKWEKRSPGLLYFGLNKI
jgi:hypothetical protein